MSSVVNTIWCKKVCEYIRYIKYKPCSSPKAVQQQHKTFHQSSSVVNIVWYENVCKYIKYKPLVICLAYEDVWKYVQAWAELSQAQPILRPADAPN